MRIVFCRKYKKELPGLEKAPFPNVLGEDLYENISKQAWRDWLAYQTMFINEKRLSTFKPDDRKLILEQMALFLSGKEVESIEGYTPVSKP